MQNKSALIYQKLIVLFAQNSFKERVMFNELNANIRIGKNESLV
jgi:hypothetical protein